MKAIDRVLQRWRIRKAARHIPPGTRVLDVGCGDGALFRFLGPRVDIGVGIDPLAQETPAKAPFRLIRGFFPHDMPEMPPFHAITALAVVEHLPDDVMAGFIAGCSRFLLPEGRLILTVPSPFVDRILAVLRFARLIDGMSLEQHHGASPSAIAASFAKPPFVLRHKERFQLGLNNLFVFGRESRPEGPVP